MRKLASVAVIVVAFAGCGKAQTQGFSAAQYCPEAQLLEDISTRLQTDATDPVKAKLGFGHLIAQAHEVQRLVPAQVKLDFDTTVRAAEQIGAALERVGFDVAQVDPKTATLLDDPTVSAASDRYDAFNRRTCPGFRFSPDSHRDEKCKTEKRTLEVAEEASFAKNGAYTGMQGLVTAGFLRSADTKYWTVKSPKGSATAPTYELEKLNVSCPS